ncbi:AsmA-like C-terminal region-containing protein [Cohaesibacter celericrescens]|uniref:AsmA domain-containing protein n=1 Tax=Cohaesibacter celericrescens TaxID=2067669 RepID=A0A2N5XLW7_9HYPH|nr:AsmA-like C-terminal region-containing protein [Cohaesibacter celericrescens]PLW75531.1 hypothetical protein C0081_19525 [Cohaesibacter celericrescens]PLW78938.1 hypothetical protein C0081_01485 [Cohaesibacter celericrescens]
MLALIVALVGPLFVDWTSYRAAFEREATVVLGQPVRVLGAADMQILPLPHLHFESVHVGPDNEAPILVVDTFDMRIELLPLLQGKIEVVDMTLRSPILRMQLDEQGQFAWRQDKGKLWDIDLEKIKLNDVRVENGRIAFDDKSTGRSKNITSLNATLQARSLIGPYKIETSFQMDGEPYSLMLSTGSASESGLHLKSLLTPVNLPVTLAMDGNVKEQEDGRYHYVGTTRLTNQIDGLEEQSVPWLLNGESDLTASSLVLPKFEFSHGPVDQAYRLNGAGTIDFGVNPRFDVVVSSRQLDLDRALGEGPNAPIDLKHGISVLADGLTKMPIPPMPGRVGFDVPGVILGGGIIRNLQLDASLVDNGWQIETLEADLPGQTRFAMAGLFSQRMDSVNSQHVFEGEARVRSDQPSAFAKWWLKDVPPGGRLEPFDLSGQVVVKSDQISIASLDLDINGDRARGQIDWYLGDGTAEKSGALTMQLKADQVNLDVVQGIGSLLLANSSGKAAPLSDISLDIETDRLLAGDFQGKKMAAKLRLANGDIRIDQLVVDDFAGAYLSTSGNLQNLTGTPRGRLEGQVRADDLNGLADLVARFLPEQPVADWFAKAQGALSPADVTFSIDGGTQGSGIEGKLSGLLGGGDVSFGGHLDGSFANWADHDLALDLQVNNPDGEKLLGLVGLGSNAIALPALASRVVVKGVLAEGASLALSLQPEQGSLTYDGTVRYSAKEGVGTKGKLALDIDDLAPYLMASGISLSNPGLALPAKLMADLDHADAVSKINNLEGQWDGQPVVGQLTYETTITDRLLKGQLELGDLDGIWLGESVVGAGRLTSLDRSWPDTAFLAPLADADAHPVKIVLGVKARSLELAAPYIFQQPKFDLIWRDNEVVVSNFDALLEGGAAIGGLQLENVNGEAVLKSHLRVTDMALAPFVWERDGRAVANGQMDVNFNVETQGRSLAGLVSGLSGNGTFTLTDGVLNYINPQAFELVVRAVDKGLELKNDDIAKAFTAHMDAGSTRVSNLAGAFRIAGGALRANNIQADADILQSRGNLMIDLSAQTINGDWSIKVEPNEEDAVTGAQPEVGLVFSGDLDAPSRVVDVAPFTGYLSIRAFEREVDRVERLQADILEKERMRRLLRLYREQAKHRQEAALAAEQAVETAKQEALRLEAQRKAEAAAKRKQLQELLAKQKAEQARIAEAAQKAALEKARLDEEAARKADAARQADAERKAAEERARREAQAALRAENERKAELEFKAAQARKIAIEKARLATEAQRKADQEAVRVEAARAEAERLAAEAQRAERDAQRIQQQSQSDDGNGRVQNGIEIRPLQELKPDADGATLLGIDGLLGDAAQDPILIQPRVLPEALFTLPQIRTVRPTQQETTSPEQNRVDPSVHNDLIEELLNSPDRIIQLD